MSTSITYSFGNSSTPTESYHSPADVDVNGDGTPDGVYLDFDGSGHKDSIAWDSDGDGKADTILVSSHHDGVYDTAYTDPAGNGHWNEVSTYDAGTHTLTVDDSAVHLADDPGSGQVHTYSVDADGSVHATDQHAAAPTPPADTHADTHQSATGHATGAPDATATTARVGDTGDDPADNPAHDGAHTFTDNDGDTVTQYADGSVTVTSTQDGSTFNYSPDGASTYTDGSGTVVHQVDGSTQTYDASGHETASTVGGDPGDTDGPGSAGNDTGVQDSDHDSGYHADDDSSTAPGSNPDGSADSWVSDQEQWAQDHGDHS